MTVMTHTVVVTAKGHLIDDLITSNGNGRCRHHGSSRRRRQSDGAKQGAGGQSDRKFRHEFHLPLTRLLRMQPTNPAR